MLSMLEYCLVTNRFYQTSVFVHDMLNALTTNDTFGFVYNFIQISDFLELLHGHRVSHTFFVKSNLKRETVVHATVLIFPLLLLLLRHLKYFPFQFISLLL